MTEYYQKLGARKNAFGFSLVSEEKVLKYLFKLGANKATGLDGIPSRFIKDSAGSVTMPIAHIINLSIITGVVPDDLKSARVVPLFKKNDNTETGNYRPVSILNIVSKVLERVVYDQFESYLLQNKLIFEYQSGFRRGFSTSTCLTHLSDHIRFQIDKRNFTGMVLLDLQKAFDTVDHGVLLIKLEAIGLDADGLRWFRSYLSDRTQLVDVHGTCSSFANVTYGVPQGSILGPLLFLIYVNDMAGAINEKILLYADDTAILVSDKHANTIEARLGTTLGTVSVWLIDNKLSLHLGKTESILSGTKRKLSNSTALNMSCNGTNIKSKSSVKYLGATIDNSLSGDAMAFGIIQKANCRLKFLYRNAKFLNRYVKRMLASSLIQCHFDYGCTSWFSGLSCKLKSKLQTTQNKIIRFVMGKHIVHTYGGGGAVVGWCDGPG